MRFSIKFFEIGLAFFLAALRFNWMRGQVAMHAWFVNHARDINDFVVTNAFLWEWQIWFSGWKALFVLFTYFYLLPKLNPKPLRLLLWTTVAFVVVWLIEYGGGLLLFQYLSEVPPPFPEYEIRWNFNFLSFSSFLVIAWVLTYIIWAAIRWLTTREAHYRLTRKEAALSQLHHQLQPHFLFNTLNNLYGMALERGTQDLAQGISQFSTLLRYLLQSGPQHKISLKEEVEYLDSYLELQKLRFAEQEIDLQFTVENTQESAIIAPLLLISLVENGFKHGISLQNPSYIHILLSTTHEQIHFRMHNSVNDKPAFGESSGLGMDYVRKLLDLVYPDRHQLDTQTTDTEYRTELTIPIA
ncbi:MAG TPA: hypothetical protein DCR93_37755 [Cytophagales bacterium]|nr:hypothetical protein [Cytophagales bacterium]HAP64990.1 hypothetical protein [Cytophagales bacterium]